MKQVFKRLLAVALILTFLVSFSACGGSKSAISDESTTSTISQETGQETNENNYDPLGKYSEPIEIKAAGILYPLETEVPPSTTPENQMFNKLAEQYLNIKIKYIWTVVPDQYDQKFNISLASGELPDIFYTNKHETYGSLVESGLAADLTEAYKYLNPELKNMYEKDAPEVIDSVKVDGKIMALPIANNKFEPVQRLYVRKDWLDALGLQPPKNYEELVKVGEAFVKNDPDKNGKADTVGLATYKHVLWAGGWNTTGIFEMFGGYANDNNFIKGSDGKLHTALLMPEVKKGLGALKELYSKGILDKEFATKDDAMVAEDIMAGKVGMVFGEWWVTGYPLNTIVENDAKADWIPIPEFTFDGKPAQPIVKRVSHNGYNMVSSKCKNPEAAVKLINLFYDAFYYKEKYGGQAEAKNGFYHNFVPIKLWNAMASVDEFKRNNEAIKTRDSSKLPVRELEDHFTKSVAFLDKGDRKGWAIYNTMVADDCGYAYVAQMAENKNVVYNEFYGNPTQSMIEKGDTLAKLAEETFVRIIMEDPIDNFDKFVEEYNKLGGTDIENEVNEWYSKLPNK